MKLEHTIQKIVKELKTYTPWSDEMIQVAKQYLIMSYIIGYEEGSRSRSNQIPVIQMTKDGDYIAEYNSIAQAARATGIDNSGIVDCCKQKPSAHTAGGYKWKYKT